MSIISVNVIGNSPVNIDSRDDTGMDFSEFVKGRRKALKLTQTALAAIAGIKQPSISAIESGETKLKDIRAETMRGLAKGLRISIDDLRACSTTVVDSLAGIYIIEGSPEHSLLDVFGDLEPADRDTVLGLAERLSSATHTTVDTPRRPRVSYAPGISNRKSLPAKIAKTARKKTTKIAADIEGEKYLRGKVEQIKSGEYGKLDDAGVALVHGIEAHLKRGKRKQGKAK